MMKAKELERLASAAYGPGWKIALARELDCTRELLWRYVTGRTPIPEYQVGPIRTICQRQIKKQIATLEKTLAALERTG